MSQQKSQIASCIKSCALFAHVSTEELSLLADAAQEQYHPKNSLVSPADQAGDGLCILRDGIARVELHDPEGNKKAISYLMPPDYFGEVSMFAQRVDTDVVAHTDLDVLFIPAQPIRDLIVSSTSCTEALLASMASRINNVRRDLHDSLFKNLEGRVAVQLLKLAYRFGEDIPEGRRITLKLTHEEIADLVGTHRETVTKILGIFRKDAAIEIVRHHVIITDKKRLQAWITDPAARQAAVKVAANLET